MDTVLIENTNKLVAPKDTLIIAGDLCGSRPEYAIEYVKKIHCKNLILVVGNHDFRALKSLEYQKLFKEITQIKFLKMFREEFVVCHYPMLVWPKRHYGAIHCHGHSHLMQNESGVARINVAVDVNDFKPLRIVDIIRLAQDLKSQG
jgi:calcineurin-like phosphoesterase family protein